MANNSTLIYERPTDAASSPDFFLTFISDLTGGLWGPMIVATVFGITYLSLSGFNSRKAFAAGSFASFVTTVLLSGVGIVGTYMFTLTGLMVALSVVINRGGEARV